MLLGTRFRIAYFSYASFLYIVPDFASRPKGQQEKGWSRFCFAVSEITILEETFCKKSAPSFAGFLSVPPV